MSTPFIGIYTAIYDYQAQNEEELSIAENDVLYLLKKSEFDDWWLVKKRVLDANIEEPQGLVPKTYIAPASPTSQAVALYDYTKQTEEELDLTEGEVLNIYDTSDPNWTLVDANGTQFGFVPGNYIELKSGAAAANAAASLPQSQPAVGGLTPFPEPAVSPLNSPPVSQSFPPPPQRKDRISSSPPAQANIANSTYQSNTDDNLGPPMPMRPATTSSTSQKNAMASSSRHNGDYSDDEAYYSDDNQNYGEADDNGHNQQTSKSFFSPGKTSRSRSNTAASSSKMSRRKSISNFLLPSKDSEEIEPIHGDFAWKVHEIEGKKKRSGILEIGNSRVYIDIDNSLSESWSISNLTNYNSEKKHVFLDFKSPTESFELRVASKDNAHAIISILGDMKGLQSQSALSDVKKAQREGIEAGNSLSVKRGIILYDFDAATDDELTCSEGDKVSIINDRKSKEWWMVENSRGRRGVVPSNYVKLISNNKNGSAKSRNNLKDSSNSSGGFLKTLLGPSSSSKSPKKKSSKDRDREERELRESARLQMEREELSKQRRRMESKERELSLRDREQREQRERIRRADERLRERRMRESSKSSSANEGSSSSKKDFDKPNSHRVRTWIDRSGAFKVEAEFLGVQQGKIHLHKLNGVKIAVSAQKLSVEDLEYVERLTGTSLQNYKPVTKNPDRVDSSNNNNNNTTNNNNSNTVNSTPSLPSREASSAVAHQRTSAVPLRADLIDYWFNFFVESGVDVAVCDRYARNFAQEQVDNTVLDGVTPALMRTLGVREGDILKIKRKIDTTLGKVTEPIIPPPSADSMGKAPMDPLPNPPTSLSDDEWATKPAAKSVMAEPAKILTPQITGSIKDLLDVKPMEPTKTGVTSIKPADTIEPAKPSVNSTTNSLNNLSLQKTGQGLLPTANAVPMVAMPTGFMPITMVPMMTGMMTGMQTGMSTLRTGGLNPALTGGMPMTTFGINSLAQPQPQQKTGGAYIMPLTTGSMPSTTFGSGIQQPNITGTGMFKLQPTGVTLQKTGGISNIPAMQPTMKTGGAFMPQTSFGVQLNNAITGGANMTGMNPALTGGFGNMPATSFGGNPVMNQMNPALTGGFGNMPATSFGGNPLMNQLNPALTGGLSNIPTTSFGGNPLMNQMNPALTGGFGNMPATSFGGNPVMNQMNPALTGGFGNMPTTSFGNVQQPMQLAQGQGQVQPLQSQATGFGFGNSIVPATTGKQANLANATADNPFGF